MTFEDWFYGCDGVVGFWDLYDKKYTDNCSIKKGSKIKALTAAKSSCKRALKHCKEVKTEEDFFIKCNGALRAQQKYWEDAKRHKKWMPWFPHAVTWLNGDRWDIEVDSHADLREQADSKPFHKTGKKPVLGKVTDIETVRKQRAKLKQMVGIKK